MTRPTDATSGARFDSPLSLWIEIWQRQLVYADAPRVATLPATVAEVRRGRTI